MRRKRTGCREGERIEGRTRRTWRGGREERRKNEQGGREEKRKEGKGKEGGKNEKGRVESARMKVYIRK